MDSNVWLWAFGLVVFAFTAGYCLAKSQASRTSLTLKSELDQIHQDTLEAMRRAADEIHN